jgi:hypothetical protein
VVPLTLHRPGQGNPGILNPQYLHGPVPASEYNSATRRCWYCRCGGVEEVEDYPEEGEGGRQCQEEAAHEKRTKTPTTFITVGGDPNTKLMNEVSN